jgi:hypothetical protein
MMARYRKLPVEIDAVQFTGKNDAEVLAFCPVAYDPEVNRPTLEIATLEGVMTAEVGDYIIRGVQGEFYPCKPDIFEQTYERVES